MTFNFCTCLGCKICGLKKWDATSEGCWNFATHNGKCEWCHKEATRIDRKPPELPSERTLEDK